MQMTVLGMAWANTLTLLWDSGVFGSSVAREGQGSF